MERLAKRLADFMQDDQPLTECVETVANLAPDEVGKGRLGAELSVGRFPSALLHASQMRNYVNDADDSVSLSRRAVVCSGFRGGKNCRCSGRDSWFGVGRGPDSRTEVGTASIARPWLASTSSHKAANTYAQRER